MKLPENYILAENSAASMLRGQNLTPMSNGHMYAVAQNVMGYSQQEETLNKPAELYNESAALPLIAAARTLQALLKAQQKRGVERDVIRRTSLLTSCAYAMAGNLPSAAAVQREIELCELAGSAELMAAAICNPACLPEILGKKEIVPAARGWLENLNSFLITGEPESEKQLRPTFEMLALQSVEMFDLALLSSARVALAHITHLSIAESALQRHPFYASFCRSPD